MVEHLWLNRSARVPVAKCPKVLSTRIAGGFKGTLQKLLQGENYDCSAIEVAVIGLNIVNDVTDSFQIFWFLD